MKTKTLDYNLPLELIAQKPADKRSGSRLLVLDRQSGEISDKMFDDFAGYLHRGDCLVLNNTKVIRARFYCSRKTGGKLEGLFLKQPRAGLWEVMLKGARKVKPGEWIILKDKTGADYCQAKLARKNSEGKCLLEVEGDFETVLEQIGYPPLPPYIKRDEQSEQVANDIERYQTVFAKRAGAIAAPTAGLHFTDEILSKLKEKGVRLAYVTLHVGAGTFKPVTAENLEDHQIHQEWISVDSENAAIINQAKQNGRRVIAVGTTSVRTLESAVSKGSVEAVNKSTQLFILPGFEFKIVDAMITNFHLPKSTLLALVCAFAGQENTLRAYDHAIAKRYRFYSYGDAMFITKRVVNQ